MQIKRRVLVIGLDGTRADLFHKLMFELGKAPCFKRLCESGQYAPCTSVFDSHAARSHDGPLTGEGFTWVTAPGWGSIITGVNNNKHLVKDNRLDSQKVFVQTSVHHPSIFKLAKSHGLQTAATGTPCFLTAFKHPGQVHWGIVDMECGLNSSDVPVVCYTDTKSATLDFRLAHCCWDAKRDEKAAFFTVDQILNHHTELIFTHFDTIDGTGHKFGFSCNENYLQAISQVDKLVEPIIGLLLERSETHSEQWLVITTSDHGGHDDDHDVMEHFDSAVPFVVNIVQDGEFSEKLSPLRQPIRNFDLAPTVLEWLGIRQSKFQFDGQVQAIGQL